MGIHYTFFPPDTILKEWYLLDAYVAGLTPEACLEGKRVDPNYENLILRIKRGGFRSRLAAVEVTMGHVDNLFAEGDMILVNGHHRLAAALDLGLETVPVVCEAQDEVYGLFDYFGETAFDLSSNELSLEPFVMV